MLNLVAPGRISPGKVFLYFHRLRLTPRKESLFKRLAAKQEFPIEVSGAKDDDKSGTLSLRLFGEYDARLLLMREE